MSHRNPPETPAGPQTFYCHICSRHLANLAVDFTCPICQGGFVELVENPPPAVFSANFSMGGNNAQGGGNNRATTTVVEPNNFEAFFRQILATPQAQQNPAPSTSQQGHPAPVQPGATAFPGFLQNLLQGLSNNGNVQIQFHFNNGEGGGENTPFTLHGNMADYAWGPGGMDAIVTQLLNQVEGGAPPMQKEKIDELPEVVISTEQVEKRLQCAVCMDDFHLAEKVCRIACEHLYHKSCIIPWLERHNSCPVCRKSAETGEVMPRSPSTDANPPTFTLFGGGAGVGAQQGAAANRSAFTFFGGGGGVGRQPRAEGHRQPAGDAAQGQQGPQPSSRDDQGGDSQWMDIDELD